MIRNALITTPRPRVHPTPAWLVAAASMLGQSGAAAQLINQSEVGPNTCGPCAVVHSLHFANHHAALDHLPGDTHPQKADAFTRTYGDATSIPYGTRRNAYHPDDGISDVDLLAMLNRFLDAADERPVEGGYVLRDEGDPGEPPEAFTRRIHGRLADSIDAGFHPLLSVRALAAERAEPQADPVWNSKGGHWIAIHRVGPVGEDELGFVIDFSDSLSAARRTGYVHFAPSRRAVVPMSFTVDAQGDEVWDWVSNQRTLELVAPGMPLGTARADWHERAFIAIRFAIIRRPGQPHAID